MRKLPTPPRLRSAPKPATKPRAPAAVRTPRSSSVEKHEYSPETGQLTVTFRGGRQYRYDGIDEATAKKVTGADSIGRALHTHVIGKFDTTKI